MRAAASKISFLWLAIVAFGFFFLPTLFDASILGDFKQFYLASQQFLHRLNSYDLNAYVRNDWYGFPYPPMAVYLTLFPSLFSFETALRIWSVINLLLHAAIVYYWVRLVWDEPVTVERYVPVFLITFSASCVWAHWMHHLIFPVLVFATLAYWHEKKGHSLLAGIFGGLMLVKPHLALVPFIALWLYDKNKGRFLCGALGVAILSLSPYLVGYRPLGDLAGLPQSIHGYQKIPYYLDEQSFPAIVHRIISADVRAGNYLTQTNRLVLHLAHGNRAYDTFKVLVFTLFLGAYGLLALRINRFMARPLCYALLLAASLFFNVYTHLYDGVLLLPLMICAMPMLLEAITPVERLMTLAMTFNIAVTVALMLATPRVYAQWSPTGFCSLFYVVSLSAILVFKRGAWAQRIRRAHADGSLFLWLALSVFGLFFFAVLNASAEGDFRQFYTASSLLLHRANAYDPLAFSTNYRHGFLYPPLALYMTLIPSLFSMNVAIEVWNVICLMAHAASVYLWIAMLWKKPVTIKEFIPVFIVTCSANCFWAHWIHHLIYPVLLFLTLAYWYQAHRRSFMAGLFGGLMLLKPHLTVIPLIALWLHDTQKLRFLSGVLLVTALSVAPYITGYRPIQDLKGMVSAATGHEGDLYYLEEQSIPSIIHRMVGYDLRKGLYKVEHDAVNVKLAHGNRSFEILKITSFLLFFMGYLIAAKRIDKRMDSPLCYAALIAGSLLFNIHTHNYDGALLLPLLICAARRAFEKMTPARLTAIALVVNGGLALLLLDFANGGSARFSPTGISSLLYFCVALIFLVHESQNAPIFDSHVQLATN